MTVNDQVGNLNKSEGGHMENDKELCEEINKSFQEVFNLKPNLP